MADKKNILSQGVGNKNISLLDAVMIKSSEIAVDEISSKTGFNGSFMSGAVKGASAVALDKMGKGKYGTGLIASGLLMDGMADLVLSFKKNFLGQTQTQQGGANIV